MTGRRFDDITFQKERNVYNIHGKKGYRFHPASPARMSLTLPSRDNLIIPGQGEFG
jgi:hypothetical protein